MIVMRPVWGRTVYNYVPVFLLLQCCAVLVYLLVIQSPRVHTDSSTGETPDLYAVTSSEESFITGTFLFGTNFKSNLKEVNEEERLKLIWTPFLASQHNSSTLQFASIFSNASDTSLVHNSSVDVLLSLKDNIGYGYHLRHIRQMQYEQRITFHNNLDKWFPVMKNEFSEAFVLSQKDEGYPQLFSSLTDSQQRSCFTEGTDWKRVGDVNTSTCVCRDHWEGEQCTVPESFTFSSANDHLNQLSVRNTSRRVINAFAFNNEFDLLETRFHELGDVVDLFVIYESNYTLYGDAKPLRLLHKLCDGFLKKFHKKIFYLFAGVFPKGHNQDGWFPEEYERSFIGHETMNNIARARLDDIFIYTDADEIPMREAIQFLRMHNGYPEPFGFSLRWSVYGFFWKQESKTEIMAGCSIYVFRYIFSSDAISLRGGNFENTQPEILGNFLKEGGKLRRWHFAEYGNNHAGWHCSWCLRPEEIQVKLVSAINADFPRWGSIPAKIELSFIRKLIQTGTWFDEISVFHDLSSNKTEPKFAPLYMLQHKDKFENILDIESAKRFMEE